MISNPIKFFEKFDVGYFFNYISIIGIACHRHSFRRVIYHLKNYYPHHIIITIIESQSGQIL